MGKETILFKSEEKKDLRSVAGFLRELADRLDQQEVVLRQGEQSITLKIPSQVELEIKVEEEEGRSKTTRKLELEIEWLTGEAANSGSGPVTLG